MPQDSFVSDPIIGLFAIGRDLVNLAIHHVSPDLVAEAQQMGLADLSIDDVDVPFAQQMAALHLPDLMAGRLVDMAIHDLTVDFAEQMQKSKRASRPWISSRDRFTVRRWPQSSSFDLTECVNRRS